MENQDITEYLVYLKENVAELKKFGKEWGMTDEEINNCIDDVLTTEDNPPQKINVKSVARKIWSWYCFGLKVWFAFMLLFLGICLIGWAVIRLHEPSEQYVSKVLQPFGYEIFRFVRLITLPIHNMANITHYYDAECIIENPFYKEPEIECGDCKSTKKVTVQHGINMTGILKKNVTYPDLQELYLKNSETLDTTVYHFESTHSDINSPRDVFRDGMEEKIAEGNNLVVKWISRTVKSAQALRKLFPRLGFVPGESEVALDKTILIEGPATQPYDLQGGFYPMTFYSLSYGERKVILTPPETCRAVCDPHQVSMVQGDVLVYNSGMFKATLLPNMKGTSIGYMGSFSE